MYRKIYDIRSTKSPNLMILVSSCICLCPIYWSRVLSREWRCSWSSADRRCSNYIWVINNLIAYKGAAYIRDLVVVLRGDGRKLNTTFRFSQKVDIEGFIGIYCSTRHFLWAVQTVRNSCSVDYIRCNFKWIVTCMFNWKHEIYRFSFQFRKTILHNIECICWGL